MDVLPSGPAVLPDLSEIVSGTIPTLGPTDGFVRVYEPAVPAGPEGP